MRSIRLAAVALSMLVVAGTAFAEGGLEGSGSSCSWPRFRGPDGDGTVTAGAFTLRDRDTPGAPAWVVDIGAGYSTPAIVDGRVYTLGNARGQDTVRCLRVEDGRQLWSYSYSAGTGGYPGPRATPTVHDGRVYTLSRDGTLLCLDARDGSRIWQRNITREYGAQQPGWDYASSVVVWNDLLLINVNSSGMAVSKSSGTLVWNSRSAAAGYATPVVAQIAGRTQALFFTESGLHGVDPATGTQFWSYDWVTDCGVNAADPVPFGNRILISSGYGHGSATIEISGTRARTVWSSHIIESQVSSLIYHDGYVYGNDGTAGSGRSYFRCIDPNTGRERWSAQASGMGSLIAVGPYLVLFTERGRLTLAELTPDAYRPVAEMQAPRGTYWAAPVLCGNHLFLRDTNGSLVCYQFGR